MPGRAHSPGELRAVERAVELADLATYALFIALGGVASYRWIKQRNESTGWFAATFLVLAAISIAGLILPEEPSGTLSTWVVKIEVAILVLFPYLLYRFTASFLDRVPWLRVLAAVLTGGIVIWTFALPRFPSGAEPWPNWFGFWIAGLLTQWSVLSMIVTVRLWVAGKGQPSVAKTRMRLMSLAAFGLTTVLILAGTASSDEEASVFALAVSLLTLLSGLAFFVGFAPPAWLRVVWRRPEAAALQRGISGLMASRTPEDVAAKLLPHVVAIVGAHGAALVDADGRVIATEGLTAEMAEEVDLERVSAEAAAGSKSEWMVLPFKFGTLLLWTSRYTPFFGKEELGLVSSLGALTDVAMERAMLFDSVERARRQLEEVNSELARREGMLTQAESISGMGSWEWDLDTGELTWSDEMYRIYGVERESFTPSFETVAALDHPDDRDRVLALVQQAIEQQEGFQFEYRTIRPSGEERALQTSGRVQIEDGTGSRRLFGVVQDVTERKESERALADAFSRERLARVGAERANAELESFVYTVSHDLNSPLISVLGYIDLLESDHAASLPEEAAFFLERIKSSSSFMQSLIRDLLELSRVGRVQTEPDAVDLEHLFEEITEEVRGGHADVAVDVSPGLPRVLMNPVRARQLFANLVHNSVKYAGRPDVRIEVAGEINGNGLVTLSVSDNGPGIPPDKRDQVFGVFERLESGQDGTGMGLAVCKRIVETSGGRIWIADSADGTDVRVSIPIAPGRSDDGVTA